MTGPKKIPSTQDHLDIEDIRDNIIILKSGASLAILQTTAINFDLLAEAEQDAMIFAFAGMLNSLTYPIQIFIRSKRMDVSSYIVRLEKAKKNIHNENLIAQIDKYENFVKNLVSKNQVLDKRFYVTIPDFGMQIPQVSSLGGLFHHRPKGMSKWKVLEKAKVNLHPKIDHLIKQLGRIGVKSIQLDTKELVELFYDLYNPEVAREQKAALGTEEYTPPMVEPKIAPIMGPQNVNAPNSINPNSEEEVGE